MPEQDPYADAAPAAPSGPPDQETQPEDTDEASADSQTAEIPKNAFGGKDIKPGDRCTFEAVRVNEDSILVKYASEDKEETAEAPHPAPAPGPGGGGSPLYQ